MCLYKSGLIYAISETFSVHFITIKVKIAAWLLATNESMAKYKTAVSPLLTYWRYCIRALNHWNDVHMNAETVHFSAIPMTVLSVCPDTTILILFYHIMHIIECHLAGCCYLEIMESSRWYLPVAIKSWLIAKSLVLLIHRYRLLVI